LQRAVEVYGQIDHFGARSGRGRVVGGIIDLHGMSLAGNRNDENDQQNQHDVNERSHVDIGTGLTVVAAEGHGHGDALLYFREAAAQARTANLRSSYTLCRLSTMGKKDTKVRMSLQTLRVLEAFLENPTVQLAGADVHQRCGIASGTLYPILLRLESAGWFVSQWESVDPSSAGRPRRRLYRLTSTGLRLSSEVFASFNRGVLA
jgi:hypothetical protein